MSNKTSRVLTLRQLQAADACETYTWRFKEFFPSGSVDLTVDLAVAQAEDWDWYFAAGAFLYDTQAWNDGVAEAERLHNETVKPYRALLSEARARRNAWLTDLAEVHGYYTDAYFAAAEAGNPVEDAPVDVAKAAWFAARQAAQKEMHKVYARVFAEIYISEGPEVPETPVVETRDPLCSCWTCKAYRGED